jgi:hypothetical protein
VSVMDEAALLEVLDEHELEVLDEHERVG